MPASIAAIVGAVVAVAGTSYELSGAGNPSYPNTAASSAELANTNAKLLPLRRQLEAAAQQGTSTTVTIPSHKEKTTMAWVPNAPTSVGQNNALTGRFGATLKNTGGKWVPYVASEWQTGGKYNPDGSVTAPRTRQRTVNLPDQQKTYDFSGYGQAQVQGQLAQEMARLQLQLSGKYDPQFIDQALQQEQLADPSGFAARQRMNDLIQEQINRPADQPVATTLNQQVQQELDAAKAGTLDPTMHDVLMNAGSGALASRGGGSDTNAPDFEQPLVTGSAGTQRQLQAIGKATSNLSSGETPEDIAYRREQQNLANLSAFENGQTPQSQFRSLSGAQTGPTPFVPGQNLPTLPTNANGAQQAAINAWQTNLQAQAGQANSWMAGLSSLLSLGKTAANLGWQPFGQGQT